MGGSVDNGIYQKLPKVENKSKRYQSRLVKGGFIGWMVRPPKKNRMEISMGTSVVDLQKMPEGKTYEDRYSGYLNVFKEIAHNNADKVVVLYPPVSWIPLLDYLCCDIVGDQTFFEHDSRLRSLWPRKNFDRTMVEVLCGFRPETTDALWKVDMQWNVAPNREKGSEHKNDFIVTTNGSFHRPEVRHYLNNVLPTYIPEKRKVVLVPCAADKPYPSKMHQAVLDRMPKDFYLANATGVLGIVPQDLWDNMPHYDSGVPYEWRLMGILSKYLQRVHHDAIVVYADFYNLAIHQAVKDSGYRSNTYFVNPVQFYADYLDLLDPARLKSLEKAFEEAS